MIVVVCRCHSSRADAKHAWGIPDPPSPAPSPSPSTSFARPFHSSSLLEALKMFLGESMDYRSDPRLRSNGFTIPEKYFGSLSHTRFVPSPNFRRVSSFSGGKVTKQVTDSDGCNACICGYESHWVSIV
jgi:hypothetical protein